MLIRCAQVGGKDWETYERILDHLAREGMRSCFWSAHDRLGLGSCVSCCCVPDGFPAVAAGNALREVGLLSGVALMGPWAEHAAG